VATAPAVAVDPAPTIAAFVITSFKVSYSFSSFFFSLFLSFVFSLSNIKISLFRLLFYPKATIAIRKIMNDI
jgi:hypothetical protein